MLVYTNTLGENMLYMVFGICYMIIAMLVALNLLNYDTNKSKLVRTIVVMAMTVCAVLLFALPYCP